MLNKYNKILKNINTEYLYLFLEFTKDFYNTWDNFTYEMLFILSTTKFKNLNINRYLKVLFLSQPECWLFYMDDKDFLEYIKNIWDSMKILYYKNDDKDFENFKKIMDILHKNKENLLEL